jgi:iron(III) transport system ATP-binding protein
VSGSLRVRGLSKAYETPALAEVDLDLDPGELVCVIGPSGSGKTTLLRCLAGLESPDAGSVEVDGRPVHLGSGLTAMLFQQDTLFPDLTVAENVGFGLRARGLRPAAIRNAVEVALLRLDLCGFEERFPDELSGGQQRRVALARALVLHPTLLLLDEPLAGLDEVLADAGLRLIRATQRRLGITTLLVTHDQATALGVADRVIVMEAGRIAQVATPREVYQRPDSVFVAQFIGRTAFLEAEVIEVRGVADGRQALTEMLGSQRWLACHSAVTPGPATVAIRPHALLAEQAAHVTKPWAEPRGDLGIVQEVWYRGERFEYAVETAHGNALAVGSLGTPLTRNQVVSLLLDEPSAWVLPAG